MIFKRALSAALFVIGCILFGTGVLTSSHFAHSRPIRPDVKAGRTYELNYHGKFVYLTRSEEWLLNSCLLGGGAVLIAGVLVERRRSK